VDPVFAEAGTYSPLTVWSAVIAYSLQIYCDFSGYSDMAIGISKIIGIDLPENFNMPYLAVSPPRFLATMAYYAFELASRLSLLLPPTASQPALG
jgi:D-alanyl-lipoteichoic acid acyltransferase DltB (MBOAT superfamily)